MSGLNYTKWEMLNVCEGLLGQLIKASEVIAVRLGKLLRDGEPPETEYKRLARVLRLQYQVRNRIRDMRAVSVDTHRTLDESELCQMAQQQLAVAQITVELACGTGGE